MDEVAAGAVVVVGECSDKHCQNEVEDRETGATVFTSLQAMHEAARASGWWVGEDHLLACPSHVRRHRGRVIGERFDRGRRDLGIRATRWFDE